MKLDHFFIKQLKVNLNLIFAFLTNLILIIFLIVFFNRQFNFLNQQKNTIANEIKKLNEKKDLILFSENLKTKNLDIDKLNKIFFLLLPNSQDYFSIILALEGISKKTNFVVTSYSLNPKESSSNRLSISITGFGDRNAFLNFVEDYNFISNRLITIDKLEFSESNLNPDKKISLNFYIDNKNKKEGFFYKLDKKDLELINKILSKINLEEDIESNNQDSISLEYEKKTNPF